MIPDSRQRIKYIISDYISTNIGWLIFTCCRYQFMVDYITSQGYRSLGHYLSDTNVILGQIFVPIIALLIYYASGYYMDIFKKTKTGDFFSSLLSTLVIVVIAFFSILINDPNEDRLSNYELILIMWGALFLPVYLTRYFITRYVNFKLKTGKWSFPTLIVGTNRNAATFIAAEIDSGKLRGYDVKGCMKLGNEEIVIRSNNNMEVIGIADIETFCKKNKISEIIIVPENTPDSELLNFINSILYLGIRIKLPNNLLEYFTSNMRISPFIDETLVEVGRFSASNFEIVIKRIIDVVGATVAMMVSLPIIVVAAIAIRRESKGSVLYVQERIGYCNKPFKIYKLRTMHIEAETSGPQLSTENDSRVTRVGKVLRKYRIDELPQFYNVIKGDMSLVGPRPERQYFIDKIMERDGNYALLHSVRPGLTSLGMVKFGYASNVDEMLQRMKYDIIYIQNLSLMADFRIMLSTVVTILKGKGK